MAFTEVEKLWCQFEEIITDIHLTFEIVNVDR